MSSLLAVALLVSGQAEGAAKSEVLDATVKAANRLPTIRALGRNWEDVPYLVGLLLVAQELDKRTPGSGQPWIDRAITVIGGGDAPITRRRLRRLCAGRHGSLSDRLTHRRAEEGESLGRYERADRVRGQGDRSHAFERLSGYALVG
jgi:hypothetical protein